MAESETTRHTCLKLEISDADPIFVKGTWYRSRFDLFITDGSEAWVCSASEEEVAERAAQWDQPVAEYVEVAERYLGFQQPGSVYGFSDALDGSKRLSWTFEKEGTKLEWRWKCKPSPDTKKATAGILDFLMESNIRLSEEVVRKTRSFEKMKAEAEKCLAQGEVICNEKREFETVTYAKFVSVLNAKKAKLRELRDKLSEQENSGNRLQEEETSGKTESFDDESDDIQSGEERKVTHHSTRRGRGHNHKRATRR